MRHLMGGTRLGISTDTVGLNAGVSVCGFRHMGCLAKHSYPMMVPSIYMVLGIDVFFGFPLGRCINAWAFSSLSRGCCILSFGARAQATMALKGLARVPVISRSISGLARLLRGATCCVRTLHDASTTYPMACGTKARASAIPISKRAREHLAPATPCSNDVCDPPLCTTCWVWRSRWPAPCWNSGLSQRGGRPTSPKAVAEDAECCGWTDRPERKPKVVGAHAGQERGSQTDLR